MAENQKPVPLTTNTAEGDITGKEALINVYPRKATGGRYKFKLIGAPGLEVFTTLPTFPVIGEHQNGDRAWAVTPTRVYEVFVDGTFNDKGAVTLSGIVKMEDNGLQLVMVDGQRGYSLDLSTEVITQYVEGGGSGWFPARTVTFQNSRFIFERFDTGQFFWSDLLSATIDPLSFATAEGQSDTTVGVLSDHRDLMIFGTASTEFWYSSGDPDLPYLPNNSAFLEKGCAAPYSITKGFEYVYFLGDDRIIYEMRGYTPRRISNNAVEKDLKGDVSGAFGYHYQEEGSLFYVLTIPSRNVTWEYDITTGSWFKKSSYGIGRHVSNNSMLFDGKTLVGDFNSGNIYHMSNDFFDDNGGPLVREFILPTIYRGRDFFTIGSFELDMTVGIGTVDGQGENPLIQTRWSTDNGNTWSNWYSLSIGEVGEYYTRVKINRLGRGRSFIMAVRISDPVKLDVGGAWVELEA